MAFSQSDLDALEAAIKEGVSRVKYTDKEVQYRSLDDMIALRDLMKRELKQSSRTKRLKGCYSKGTE